MIYIILLQFVMFIYLGLLLVPSFPRWNMLWLYTCVTPQERWNKKEFIEVPELDFMMGKFVMPSGIVWLYVIVLGLLGTLSQYFMTKAYGETKAGIVGAVSYTNIVFAIFVGMLLGDSLPSMITSIGIILIVIAGIMVARAK